MKLFGKELFEKSRAIRLYDFAQHGLLRLGSGYGEEYVQLVTVDEAVAAIESKKKKDRAKEAAKPKPTPKELYTLGTLSIPHMEVNVDADYIAEQQRILDGKLELLPEPPKKKKRGQSNEGIAIFDEPGAVRYGRLEIQSMRDRLGYRKYLMGNKKVVDEYPHTTTDKIRELLAANKHLEAKQAYDTLPDLPGEAVDAMKAYTDMTKKVSGGKLPVFYLIAEKKDSSKVARRRDPILLVQSPFGFFWQVLGAWDDEIKFLEEL